MKIFYVILSGLIAFSIFLVVFSIGWPRFIKADEYVLIICFQKFIFLLTFVKKSDFLSKHITAFWAIKHVITKNVQHIFFMEQEKIFEIPMTTSNIYCVYTPTITLTLKLCFFFKLIGKQALLQLLYLL